MKTFFSPLKEAPGSNPQHLGEPLSFAPTHPALLHRHSLFTASRIGGTCKSSPAAGWGHAPAAGGTQCLRSRVGRNGSHFFASCFLASHLGRLRIQPGNKTQNNSLSTGQPAEPKAAASAIPSRVQSTARYSCLQSSNQPPEVWSVCSSSLRWKQQGLTQETAWRLKLTASSRIWATVRDVHLQIQPQRRAGAVASPSTGRASCAGSPAATRRDLPPRCLRKQRLRCQKTEGRSSRLLLEAGPWDRECSGKKAMQNSDMGRMGRTWPTPITACCSPTPRGKPCGAEGNRRAHASEQHPTVCRHPTVQLPPPTHRT